MNQGADQLVQILTIPNKVSGHDNVTALKTIIDILRSNTQVNIKVTDIDIVTDKDLSGVDITLY